MRPNDEVTLVSGSHRRRAKVAAVTGSGKSGYKTLSIHQDGAVLDGVPHAQDAAEGATHWTEEPVATPDTVPYTVPPVTVIQPEAEGAA